MDLTIPTINLNGSPREMLMGGYAEAHSAVQDAIDMVAKTAPNGRDYYLAPGTLRLAEIEHAERMKTLQDVASQLWRLAIAIDEAAE